MKTYRRLLIMIAGFLTMASAISAWFNIAPISLGLGQALGGIIPPISVGDLRLDVQLLNFINMMSLLMVVGVILITSAVLGSKGLSIIATGLLVGSFAIIMLATGNNLVSIISNLSQVGRGIYLSSAAIILLIVSLIMPKLTRLRHKV